MKKPKFLVSILLASEYFCQCIYAFCVFYIAVLVDLLRLDFGWSHAVLVRWWCPQRCSCSLVVLVQSHCLVPPYAL